MFQCVCCGNYADDGCIFDCVCLACIESNFIDTISDIGIYKQIPQAVTPAATVTCQLPEVSRYKH